MKILPILAVLAAAGWHSAEAAQRRVVCYYDTGSAKRTGDAQFTPKDMALPLRHCTHIVYGYVGITFNTFEVAPLNLQQEQEMEQMSRYKQMNPNVKFLLSLGGDQDKAKAEKYMDLLEASYQRQQAFVMTSRDILVKYGFDGLDLAYQFPRTKPKKFHNSAGSLWKNIKKKFTGNYVVDHKSQEHKKQFSELVNLLRISLKPEGLMLTLTVLPNVNAESYFDIPNISKKLDFITLAAFDFYTPSRNPEEADYSAPIYAPPAMANRLPNANVDSQVKIWLSQEVPGSQLNLGIATWGRSWKLTPKSTPNAQPVVSQTKGPGPAGPLSKTPGFLSWPEICMKFRQQPNRGQGSSLSRIVDSSKRYGNYGLHAVGKYGNNGVWVSYEEPQTASYKASMVRDRNLGGVALFDIGYDDIKGVCSGEPFPILSAIKYELR